MAFMPEYAPFVFLGLLGTGFFLAVATLAIIVTFVLGKRRLSRWAVVAVVVVAGGYGTTLLFASLTSHARALAAGERKYFCEVDCHEAYSVTSVTTARTLGPRSNPTTANGTFYIVKIKVWFDPSTINPRRGNGYLHPNSHVAMVVDERGREFSVSSRGQEALESSAGHAIPFTQLLLPGDSFETTRVFDVPADAKNPQLYVTTPEWVTCFMIGHENSFFHAKTTFRLVPTAEAGQLAGKGW